MNCHVNTERTGQLSDTPSITFCFQTRCGSSHGCAACFREVGLGKFSDLSFPAAIAQTKKVLDELWPSSFNHELDETLLHHLSARNSSEAREGVATFLEKRSPKWQPGSKANSK